MPFMQKTLGIHHIRTKIYSLPLSKLHSLFNLCLETIVTNPHSNQYKLIATISDISSHRLFKSVRIRKDEKSVPIITYIYTKPIATKIFNYKHVLQDVNIDYFKSKAPDCTCASSQFTYNPAGHVITGDLNIVNNPSVRNLLSKGPKYREPKSLNWKYNFKLLMDSVEEYAR